MEKGFRVTRLNISIGIALLFHVSGYLGMQSAYREWFIDMTPLTLLLMTVLVILNEKNAGIRFKSFAGLAAVTGFVTELIGVNTGLLFGDYAYGSSMGPKWHGVPFLIGIQWFITVYGAAQLTLLLYSKSLPSAENSRMRNLSMVLTGAAITTIFDWILEPAAIQLGYWNWFPAGDIPLYNYACWFMISALILIPYFFKKISPEPTNVFVMILMVIEAVFFILLGK
jgi:putative membrane protein